MDYQALMATALDPGADGLGARRAAVVLGWDNPKGSTSSPSASLTPDTAAPPPGSGAETTTPLTTSAESPANTVPM
uniref:hypothetical protein n=1 Tax=Streptomyces sp. NBC_01562 TaxID=2975879 RepID=UPI002F9111D5